MAFIKGFLFFIIMVLLVYGVTGLTAKESIVFTAFGFGISAILCSFIGIMVVLVVTMCLFAFEELGALPRLFGAQIILLLCGTLYLPWFCRMKKHAPYSVLISTIFHRICFTV